MRPVTRGGVPGTYPNHIRLDTQAHLQTDASATWWQFNGPLIRTAFGTNQPTLWQLMNRALLRIARDNADGDTPPAKYTNVEDRIWARLSDNQNGYKAAQHGLLGRLGSFCSYCEQYMPGAIAIEHCIPKARYPLFTLCWDNFLLSCNACNLASGKGQKPSRNTANNWGDFDDEVELYDGIRGRYFWPDVDDNSYRALWPRLLYRGNNGLWNEFAGNNAVRAGTVRQADDLPTRTIEARIYVNHAWHDNVEVSCQLHSSNPEAVRSISYYGLDRDGTATPAITDRRMYNRTLAWLQVLTAVQPFMGPINAGTFNAFWPGLIQSVRATGFFSVWVRVLDMLGATNQNVPGARQTIMARFLNDIAADFPGTDFTNIP